MYLKLTRQQLLGDVVRPKGHVFPAEGRYAEQLVKSGAAVPVPAPVETASAVPDAERAIRRGPR